MIGPITVKLDGVDELLRNVQRASETIQRNVRRVIASYALKIEAEAKRRAPVGLTGNLRATITAELERLAEFIADVVARADYSAFVEFGTGQRGAASGVEPVPPYSYGEIAGAAAQPFLFPAFEMHRAAYVRDLREAIGAV